jgi:hypothetical protein
MFALSSMLQIASGPSLRATLSTRPAERVDLPSQIQLKYSNSQHVYSLSLIILLLTTTLS